MEWRKHRKLALRLACVFRRKLIKCYLPFECLRFLNSFWPVSAKFDKEIEISYISSTYLCHEGQVLSVLSLQAQVSWLVLLDIREDTQAQVLSAAWFSPTQPTWESLLRLPQLQEKLSSAASPYPR